MHDARGSQNQFAGLASLGFLSDGEKAHTRQHVVEFILMDVIVQGLGLARPLSVICVLLKRVQADIIITRFSRISKVFASSDA